MPSIPPIPYQRGRVNGQRAACVRLVTRKYSLQVRPLGGRWLVSRFSSRSPSGSVRAAATRSMRNPGTSPSLSIVIRSPVSLLWNRIAGQALDRRILPPPPTPSQAPSRLPPGNPDERAAHALPRGVDVSRSGIGAHKGFLPLRTDTRARDREASVSNPGLTRTRVTRSQDAGLS